MLSSWIYPLIDWFVYPLFWLPPTWGITLISVVLGVALLGLYAVTSDQWSMAYYKDRLKRVQHSFTTGGNRWEDFLKLVRLNLKMAWQGVIPAIVCIAALLLIIPWVGNRFGYHPLNQYEPFEVTVQSERAWRPEGDRSVRLAQKRQRYEPGQTTIRLLIEGADGPRLKLISGDSEADSSLNNQASMVPLDFMMEGSDVPVWPDIGSRQWYHGLVKPAGQVLDGSGPFSKISVHYEPVFPYMSLYIPFSGTLPGWLTWFFLVSFLAGLVVKFQWEIE